MLPFLFYLEQVCHTNRTKVLFYLLFGLWSSVIIFPHLFSSSNIFLSLWPSPLILVMWIHSISFLVCRVFFSILLTGSFGISFLLNIWLFLIVHISHIASVILSMYASFVHLGLSLSCIDPSPLISSIVGWGHWVFGKVCFHSLSM